MVAFKINGDEELAAMGRLPQMWADRPITMRVPYNAPGELILGSASDPTQFPDATFANNVDKPWEIHRLIPRVTALDNNGVALTPQPDQELLQSLVRVTINDLGKNQMITKNPTLMHLLTKGTTERSWEWADPYYLVRSESLQVAVQTLVFPAIANLATLRIEMDFQGFLCVVAPATNTR